MAHNRDKQVNGRDENGRFIKGHSGNYKGRPKKVVDYAAIISSTLSESDWAKIVKRAISDAKSGDRYARKWLSDYILGHTPINFDDSSEKMTLAEWQERANERIQEVSNANRNGSLLDGGEQQAPPD